MKLYHSSPYEIQSGILNPTTKNIALTPEGDGRTIATFTEYDDANVPYLFATDNPQLSMTYTVPKGIRLMNLHGHGGTEILFLDQEGLVGDSDLKGGMYSFESDNFSQIHCDGKAIDQWVSDRQVNLRGAAFTPVRNINDVLKASVQVYQLGDRDDYKAQDFHEEMAGYDDQQILSRISGLIEEGKLRWLNQERGINPINCLVLQKNQTSAAAMVMLPAPA